MGQDHNFMLAPLALLLLFGLALLIVDSSAQKGPSPFTNPVAEHSDAVSNSDTSRSYSTPPYSRAPYQNAAASNWSPPQQTRSWYAPKPPASGAPVSADPDPDEDPVDEVSSEEPYVDGENSTIADGKEEGKSRAKGAGEE
jgi:hypothetical protein